MLGSGHTIKSNGSFIIDANGIENSKGCGYAIIVIRDEFFDLRQITHSAISPSSFNWNTGASQLLVIINTSTTYISVSIIKFPFRNIFYFQEGKRIIAFSWFSEMVAIFLFFEINGHINFFSFFVKINFMNLKILKK